MAFVAPSLTGLRPAHVATRSATSPFVAPTPPVAARGGRRAPVAVRMMASPGGGGPPPAKRKFGKVAEASAAKVASAATGTFGWVPAAERLNGRAAMFGFLLGLTTEVLSGHSIYTQVRVLEQVNKWLF